MEYDRLYKILPDFPYKWNYDQVGLWLEFIGLPQINHQFSFLLIKIIIYLIHRNIKSRRFLFGSIE